MRTSELVLGRTDLVRAGLGRRVQGLHSIVRARFPAIARIALALYDPETDLLKTFVSSTDQGQALQHYEAKLSEVPSLQRMVAERRARVVEDIASSFHADSTHTAWLKAQHYSSSYTLPIFHGEQLTAFLFFDALVPGVFQPDVTEVLDELAEIITQLYFLRLSAVQHLIGGVDIATGLARIRDVETGLHLERIAKYSRLIARGVAAHYALSDETIEYLHLFAPLHDIGKVGIPDSILLKPGRLDADELKVMRQHVNLGETLTEHIVADLGLEHDPAAEVMRQVVAAHHERNDGSGYPRGLVGDAIPVVARIVAVADVYDALSSSRPYKQPWTEARCAEELRSQVARGQLDGPCVDALLADDAARAAIRQHFSD